MMKLPHILFAVGCIGSLFFYSHQFTDAYIVPKWCLALSVLFVMLVYASVRALLRKFVSADVPMWGSTIVLGCVLQAFYGISQFSGLFSSHSIYKVTGSFDNPAGFASCLCAGLPFVAFLLSNKNKYVRYIGWVAIIIIVSAVILSYSRAGIVSVAALCCLFLYERMIQRKVLKFALLTGLVLLLFGCYHMKKDSADGRLLIWRCGINMIKDAPLLGHGVGSFEAHYMDYQANYFREHQTSRFSMLADNVKHPFNEYMGILMNFGIAGFTLLLMALAWLFYCYKKNPVIEKKIALHALVSIGTFSLFSYPFTYPFTWIIALFSVYLITKEHIKFHSVMPWMRNTIYVSVLICSLGGIYKLIERTRAELHWQKTSALALCRLYNKALPAYEELKEVFADNPYFLYNYAAVLTENKQYQKALEIALQCRQYWADYDLDLMIGENYQYLKELKSAEMYYSNAAMMCPSRFYPLYQLYELYKEARDETKAFLIAETILEKPVKINSVLVRQIKSEIKEEFESLKFE